MSFNQLGDRVNDLLTDEQLEMIRKERCSSLQVEFEREIKKHLLPMLLMPEDFLAAMDITLGVDRREPMITALKKMVSILEKCTMLELVEKV